MKPEVLFLDDDPGFRLALNAVIDKLGMTPREAQDPAEFLAKAQEKLPQICLVDLNLGDASGVDVIAEFRKRFGTAIPILVVSGESDPVSLTHALETGATDFVLKPLDRSLLASKLARYLKLPELSEYRANYVDVPNAPAAAKLSFGCQVESVDELGVWVASPHLIPKGTVLRINGEFLDQIAGVSGQSYLVTVGPTSFDPVTKRYGAYCEFDEVKPEFMQQLRRWLNLRPGT